MPTKSEQLFGKGNYSTSDILRLHILAELERITAGSSSTGLATETTLANLLTELQLKADLSETQPVSAASLPLPVGASTEATLAAILAKIIAAPSTEAKQDAEIAKLNDALGGNGTEFIFGVGAITGKSYKYLVANEDCTFTTLTGATTANLLAALPTGLGITTNTVSKGMVIRGKNGELITEVTLATGSVIGVN